mgnify:FL=1
MKNIHIVSGGDTKYFNLLKELLESIDKLKIDKKAKISILDGGLKKKEIDYFQSKKIKVIDPGWPSKLAKLRASNKNYLKVELAKVHLDRIFSDAEYIIWVDADAWFQTTEALNIIKSVLEKKKLAIVSQTSRFIANYMIVKRFLGSLFFIKNLLYKNAKRANLSKDLIEEMISKPTLNAGIFGLPKRAPHWNRLRLWQDKLLKTTRARVFTITQLSLAVISYYENLPYEAIPERCNYMGPYRWSRKLKKFVEYYAPYEPISIIHMVARDEMRTNKFFKIPMLDENDRKIKKSLRYNAQHK